MSPRTTTRTMFAACCLVPCVLLGLTGHGHAQTAPAPRAATRPSARRVEIAIEGTRRVVRGSVARWIVTAFDVVGTSELRALPGAHIVVTSSLAVGRAVVAPATDASGRAIVSLDVPADAREAFHVSFELTADAQTRRSFDLEVTPVPAMRIVLAPDRLRVQRGEQVVVLGRVLDTLTARPMAGIEVETDLLRSPDVRLRPTAHVRTDGWGAFRELVRLPETLAQPATFTASVGRGALRQTTQVTLTAIDAPANVMSVVVAPESQTVAPGARVLVHVVVRTPDGRPLPHTLLHSTALPRRADGTPGQIETDVRGRATFTYTAPPISEALRDATIAVSATHSGVGERDGSATIRIARDARAAGLAVEGGSLIVGAPNRVFVRVVRSDGVAAGAGASVTLTLGAQPALHADTDADGVATLDVPLTSSAASPRANPDDDADRCGGGTAISYRVEIVDASSRGGREGCLPIDLDASVRVRVARLRVAPGGEIRVTIARSAAVQSLPVEVALALRDENAVVPFDATVLPAGVTSANLRVPATASGAILVRARPLYGAARVPVRGGTQWVIVERGVGAQVDLQTRRDGGVQLARRGGDADGAVGVRALAVPRSEASAFLDRLAQADPASFLVGTVAAGAQRPLHRGDALLAATLAANAHVDGAAPGAIRAGHLVTLPAPESPVSHGMLRDPWRSQARFVAGRLARVFREVERHVGERGARHRDDVAWRDPSGRWQFNDEMLEVLAEHESLEGEGSIAPGGDRLTLAQLRRIDPAFTFDNVARRITRRRLFLVLAVLRRYVRAHGMDVPGARLGDPTHWLAALPDQSTDDSNDLQLSRNDLMDGWGTAFVLRRTSRPTPHSGWLDAVSGYELVSAGPDGRVGSADDVRDPFARVLPSGGAYARAVDEDGFLARVQRVETGRGVLTAVSTLFGIESPESTAGDDDEQSTVRSSWFDVPAPVDHDPLAAATLRPDEGFSSWDGSAVVPTGSQGQTVLTPNVASDRRTVALIVDAWSAQGPVQRSTVALESGDALHVELPFDDGPDPDSPRRWIAGLALPIRGYVLNAGETPAAVEVTVHGAGSIDASMTQTLSVPAGGEAPIEFVVRASSAGSGSVHVVLRSGGRTLRDVREHFDVDSGGIPMRVDDFAWLDGASSARTFSFVRRAGDRLVDATLRVRVPSALVLDAELDELRELDPAVVAWAHVVLGRSVPPALLARLESTTPIVVPRTYRSRGRRAAVPPSVVGASDALDAVCAAIAFASADRAAEEPTGDDDSADVAPSRARRALRRDANSGGWAAADSVAGGVRENAAELLALALAGAADEQGGLGDGGAAARGARGELRTASASLAAVPSVLARAAAALLVADGNDASGRAHYERALTSVSRDRAGRAWLEPSEDRRDERERFIGTAAMAIAALQRGDPANARAFAQWLTVRVPFGLRQGTEPAFWLLGAAAAGVFGTDATAAPLVRIDGSSAAPRPLVDGVLELSAMRSAEPFTVTRSGAAGAAPSGGLFAHAAWRFERVYRTDLSGPVRIVQRGDPGFAQERAALEIAVTPQAAEPERRLAVEIQLPPGVDFDADARAAIASRPDVLSVNAREHGVVRVLVSRLSQQQTLTLPLTFRWRAHGRVPGVGVVAYAVDAPTRVSVLAPAAFDVRLR